MAQLFIIFLFLCSTMLFGTMIFSLFPKMIPFALYFIFLLSTYLSIFPYLYLYLAISLYLAINLSICHFINLSIYLYLSICHYLFSIYLSIYLAWFIETFHQFYPLLVKEGLKTNHSYKHNTRVGG